MPKPSIFKKINLLRNFFRDKNIYISLKENSKSKFSEKLFKPCIYDKTNDTPLDPVYFYQDTWCASKIFQNKPKHHFDIGSQAEMVGIISQFIPTTMIDIRPINLSLDNLFFVKGSALNLPFKNGQLESLSLICVIEHIGLGRYGDTIDPFGSEKAIIEIKRVLAKNGDLYISVPIDKENNLYYNAHRSFTRDYIIELFNDLSLMEEKYIYGNKMYDKYEKEKGFGTGLFYFKK